MIVRSADRDAVSPPFTEIRYDADGNPLRITDTEGKQTTYTYVGRGRRTRLTDGAGNTIVYRYFDDPEAPADVPGRYSQVWRIEYPTYAVEYEYDAMGRVTKQTVIADRAKPLAADADPGTLIVTRYEHRYENGVRVTLGTDPEGKVTRYEYDRLDRLAKVTYPLTWQGQPVTVEYGYGPRGNLRWVKDPRDGVTRYEYDRVDRLTASTAPATPTGRRFGRMCTTTPPARCR